MIVVDASIAVKWAVHESGREDALRVLDSSELIIAPDLLLPEISNVFRKKLKRGEVSQPQVIAAFSAITIAIRKFVPSLELIEDAFSPSQRLDHSVYDCFYLACALPIGRLISADQKFVSKCRGGGFAPFVLTAGELTGEVSNRDDPNTGVQASTLDTIRRLAVKLEQTLDSLRGNARAEKGSGLRFVSSAAIIPALESPAYLRLSEVLTTVDDNELALLVALGWIGRSYHGVQEWPDLLRNARQMVAQDRAGHMRYFIAQMANVSPGIEKLRAMHSF